MKKFFQWLYKLFFSDIVMESEPINANQSSQPLQPVPIEPAVMPVVGPSRIDNWCEAAKQMEGAKPERNNPGNLRFVGQKFAVNDGGFCKFDTYAHGYAALKTLFTNACEGKSKIYSPTMNLYEFYNKYAPSSDGNNPKHYAEFVANIIGVLPTIQIRQLL